VRSGGLISERDINAAADGDKESGRKISDADQF